MPKSFETASESHTPETTKRQDFRAFQQELRTMSPGIIRAVNGFRCDVEPVWERKAGSENIAHSVLLDVPVLTPSASGFYISGPLSVGSECLIFWSERESESFITRGGVNPLRNARIHDYADPFVMPCQISDPSIGVLETPDNDALNIFGGNGVKLNIDVNGVNLVECMRDLAQIVRDNATASGNAAGAAEAVLITAKLGTLL